MGGSNLPHCLPVYTSGAMSIPTIRTQRSTRHPNIPRRELTQQHSYVAATRARVALHVSDVDALADQPESQTPLRTSTRPTPKDSPTPHDRAQAAGGARTIGTVIRATLRNVGRRPAPDIESR